MNNAIRLLAAALLLLLLIAGACQRQSIAAGVRPACAAPGNVSS
jgi:hypothetical protein